MGGQFTANELLTLWGDLFRELQGCKPVLEVHSHVESKLWVGTAEEHVLSDVWLEEDPSDVSDQDVLLRLILDRLDGVYHADVLALLEGDLSDFKLDKLEALLAKHFKELLGEAVSDTSDFNGVLEPMAGQVLKEIAKVAFVRVVVTTPLVHVRVGSEVLAADAISTRV